MDAEAIREIFETFGPVQIRRMFGGQGVYRDGLMFALEASGELYLKADTESEGTFRELGSRPFTYAAKGGRTTAMSYWLMPESALDDQDEAADLARLAFQSALRAKAAKPKAKKAKNPSPMRKARKPASEPAL
ncbi:TfoX/Sxy family protein [Microvirga sp. ACRRW]|uniref:TfoX/Sxy family protein n=1 Tax=Microvirga sp. ACRRW TaxID=2918205 RepID=UPI001EF5F4D2|nr:TfoX/Sxy family protein [Microvirga sp. ACRRW]MCG7394195.1 TfoX/Sxy family protein [Microvirga sp. ACRRW]